MGLIGLGVNRNNNKNISSSAAQAGSCLVNAKFSFKTFFISTRPLAWLPIQNYTSIQG